MAREKGRFLSITPETKGRCRRTSLKGRNRVQDAPTEKKKGKRGFTSKLLFLAFF